MSLPAVTSRLYSSDEVQYFSYLRSLYFDRDVSFENEYRYFHEAGIAQSPGFEETFLIRETAVGRRVNYATMGAAILWSPFYAVADVWTRLGGGHAADGFSRLYISAVAYGSAVYGFLAVLLSVRAARIVLGRPGTLLAGLAVWLGTPLLFYMYVAPPFAHACSAFSVALFVNVWLHVRRTWSAGGTFVLGLCAALLAMVREQDVFLALGPVVDFLYTAVNFNLQTSNFKKGITGSSDASPEGPRHRSSRAWLVTAAAGVAGTAAGYVPQLLAYNALNGYPGPAEHVSRKMSWYAPHGLQVLASPQHGFFFWTPLAVLAVGGLVAMLTRGTDVKRIGTCLLLMVLSQVYIAGSVESWTVAGAFGQRRFVCLTIVITIGIAALRQLANRRALTVVVACCAWWNVALMAQFATRTMDRQRLEPARNAYTSFVTLPLQVPALAYRYLTDRESFYERRGSRPDR